MPLYVFQCECGVRFEQEARMKDHAKPATCPDCGEEAPRWVPDEVSGVMHHPVSGPGPQNTGTSKDVDYDRVIGESAEVGWKEQTLRDTEKARVIASEGAARADLSLQPDGTYKVLKPEERGVHDRALNIHNRAMALRKGLGKKSSR